MAPANAPRIVFLCVHNAGRSQMAAAAALHLAAGEIEVLSGGSDPAADINPVAVAAMTEIGIDIGGARPRRWTDDDVKTAAIVVTMGCGDTCPYFAGVRYEDWEIPDPAGLTLEAVRPIRDEIVARVRTMLNGLLADRAPGAQPR